MKRLICVLFLVGVFLTSCSQRTITRTNPGLITDLSGRWNDTDARMVAHSLVEKILTGAWLSNHIRNVEDSPYITVGRVVNATTEHLETDTFMDEIESALIASGEVYLIARMNERQGIRAERADQTLFSSGETAAEWGNETGAQYVITGTIRTIVDEYGDERVIYYQISLDITNTETNVKVWSGNHELKKILEW